LNIKIGTLGYIFSLLGHCIIIGRLRQKLIIFQIKNVLIFFFTAAGLCAQHFRRLLNINLKPTKRNSSGRMSLTVIALPFCELIWYEKQIENFEKK
jgi:hypothetical protein